ncbi:MAG: hypothetical protein ABJE95_07635 [Byssovorax sp.]
MTHPLSPALLLVITTALTGAVGCADYEDPPSVTLDGVTNGHLSDTKAPLVLTFSKPPDPATVHIEIVRFVTDVEGDLADEDSNPATTLDVLYKFPSGLGEGAVSGPGVFSSDGTRLTITPKTELPIGAGLAILVEKGLSDTTGHVTAVRKRIPFSYRFDLGCTKPSKVFHSGTYFFLADVKKPVPVQVKLFAAINVDPATGEIVGRFTNAVRNPDPKRCTPACPASEACRLLPMQECVTPSLRAGTVDEFTDFVTNATPPTGFSFQTTGCVIDQADGTAAFITAPIDVVVKSPPVTLTKTQITGSFKLSGDILRGSGAITAENVLLGTTSSEEAASGEMSARTIPANPDIPLPE